ncbi:MAG: hypothetical protein HY860_04405 [Chlamydiales bacterium]|nr:hypothetical protein [Chlamydiales bacterium]
MNIKQIFLYKYDCNLKYFINNRLGFIVEIILTNGESRYGEIAPLPGFSKESLKKAFIQLNQLLPQLINKELSFIHHLLKKALYPSVLFGLYSLLFPNTSAEGITSGLLYQTNYKEEIDLLLASNIRFAKIKVGSFSIDETITYVKNILSYTDQIAFHIDVNRKWKKKELDLFLSSIGPDQIRYIEEPLCNKRAFLSFINKKKHRFACDESLRQCSDLPLQKIDYLIIKPTIQRDMLPIITGYQHKVILSSSFETLVGIKSICHLAHAFNITTPLGIDTLKAFHQPICVSSYEIKDGMINIDPIKLDKNRLTTLLVC